MAGRPQINAGQLSSALRDKQDQDLFGRLGKQMEQREKGSWKGALTAAIPVVIAIGAYVSTLQSAAEKEAGTTTPDKDIIDFYGKESEEHNKQIEAEKKKQEEAAKPTIGKTKTKAAPAQAAPAKAEPIKKSEAPVATPAPEGGVAKPQAIAYESPKTKAAKKEKVRYPASEAPIAAKQTGNFYADMIPFATKASQMLGGKIPPEAIVGQWGTETGGGKHISAPFNYAGIKAGKNYKRGGYVLTEEKYSDAQITQAQKSGETLEKVLGPNDKIKKHGRDVTIDEWYGKGQVGAAEAQGKHWVQVRSYFAKFDDMDDFVQGYVKFLSAPRYAKAREATTPAAFGSELVRAGYATTSEKEYSASIASYSSGHASSTPVPPATTNPIQVASAAPVKQETAPADIPKSPKSGAKKRNVQVAVQDQTPPVPMDTSPPPPQMMLMKDKSGRMVAYQS